MAIIFIVNLADYDQVLSGDATQTRMTQILLVFDSVVNS